MGHRFGLKSRVPFSGVPGSRDVLGGLGFSRGFPFRTSLEAGGFFLLPSSHGREDPFAPAPYPRRPRRPQDLGREDPFAPAPYPRRPRAPRPYPYTVSSVHVHSLVRTRSHPILPVRT